MSGRREIPSAVQPTDGHDIGALVSSIIEVHHQTKKYALKAVNVALSIRNWLIGFNILEFELKGSNRAVYGEQMLDVLSQRLSEQGLHRVTARELRRFRQFYQAYPNIWESATPKSLAVAGLGSLAPLVLRATSHTQESKRLETEPLTCSPTEIHRPHADILFRLSFTHLAEIIQLPDDTHRRFYEVECMRGHWSVRELRRQIASLYYERSGFSMDKSKVSKITNAASERVNLDRIVRDPYIFEFLGLRSHDSMGETDLEDALLDRLQEFLLEMGHGFCFEARQKRILIGDEHFFVDLVFYHRVLKCHVLVELKADAFRHEHLGQLNTYVAYYKRHEMTESDQPPIGILLCTQKNDALVEFALGDISNQLFVSRYALEIPNKSDMESFLLQLAKELGYE
jgi:predicted nuclease of restriction endonuclease-like (RecB) superfamily